ncbi:MAG: hypothetical protein Q7V88_15675 [Actinomycetota bacterium]|nr:hypothetical protein [Actinomycetota bacterium]
MKGGSGTTVVSAALALVLSRRRPTLLVDLAGDAPAALGLPEPAGPGVADWLASPTADAAALHRLAVPATDTLALLPRGSQAPGGRWADLAVALAGATTASALEGTAAGPAGDAGTGAGAVVVDAGTGAPPPALLAAATHQLLVTRPCYLALRRAAASGLQPSGIVLLTEPGRALTAHDVERALGAPVVAELAYDPTVARAVDAGLLAARLPRSLAQQLKGAA